MSFGSPPKSFRPTLVVLSTIDQPTSYQKKKFTLKEHQKRYFPDSNSENVTVDNNDDVYNAFLNSQEALSSLREKNKSETQENKQNSENLNEIIEIEQQEKENPQEKISSPQKKSKIPVFSKKRRKKEILLPENEEESSDSSDQNDPDLNFDVNQAESWNSDHLKDNSEEENESDDEDFNNEKDKDDLEDDLDGEDEKEIKNKDDLEDKSREKEKDEDAKAKESKEEDKIKKKNGSEDPFDVFRSPGDLGPEIPSVATSAFSDAVDEQTMQSAFLRQISYEKIFFADDFFKSCDNHQQRQLSRIARLQTSHRQHWILNVWKTFNNGNETKDMLFSTINITAHQREDNVSWDNGLFASVSKELKRFMRSSCDCTPSYFMKACIVGPSKSGKTTFLRTMILHHLINLMVSGVFKSTFVISFDFRESKKELNDYYSLFKFYMNKAIDSLEAQRQDVSAYLPSIRKVIETFKEGGTPKIPKPLTTQNYLRRPLCDIESLLCMFHEMLEKEMFAEFIDDVTLIPHNISTIFGFSNTLVVIDHIDYCDIDIIIPIKYKREKTKISLLQSIKRSLQCSQFLISAEDGESLIEKLTENESGDVDLSSTAQIITVAGKCQPQSCATVVAKTSDGKKINIVPELCAGCPQYVMQYEQVVREAGRIEGLDKSQKPAAKAKLITQVESLIPLLYDTTNEQNQKIEIKDIDVIAK